MHRVAENRGELHCMDHSKTNRRYADGRVVFLAKRDDIGQALKTGITIKAVYADSPLASLISYAQFRRYVCRFLPEQSTIQRWGGKARSRQGGETAQHTQARAAIEPGRSIPPPPLPGPSTGIGDNRNVDDGSPRASPRRQGFQRFIGDAQEEFEKLVYGRKAV